MDQQLGYSIEINIIIHTLGSKMTKASNEVQKFLKRLQELKGMHFFPKKELMQICERNCPPIQDIINACKDMNERYKENNKMFKQVVMLQYITIVKGSTQLLEDSLELIQDVIVYKALLLCVQSGKVVVVQIYNYLQNLLDILIPTLFLSQYEQKIMKIFQKTSKVTQILNIVFQALFITKIKSCLEPSNHSQFCQYLKQIYPKTKFIILNHIFVSDSCPSKLQLYNLAFFRSNQENYQLYDLLVDGKRVTKHPSDRKVEEWVIQSHKVEPVKIDIDRIVNGNSRIYRKGRMKIMEFYNFLKGLEIYGSSPKIQVLNEYLQNEDFLETFGKFLLGQNLAKEKYRYGNEEWRKVLTFCSEQINKLPSSYRPLVCKQIQKNIK